MGAGIHITQTAGLALATDLTPVETQPKVVGLMYVMLLLGSIVSALVFGALLANFTPGRLVQVIQGSAVVTLVLNAVAVWKQEPRGRAAQRRNAEPDPVFQQSWACFIEGGHAIQRLLAVGLGTQTFNGVTGGKSGSPSQGR